MKLNDKGMLIPNAFCNSYRGTTQEVMNDLCEDGYVVNASPFWEDQPAQQWTAFVLGEEEVDLLAKVLESSPGEISPSEKGVAETLATLLRATQGEQERARAASV